MKKKISQFVAIWVFFGALPGCGSDSNEIVAESFSDEENKLISEYVRKVDVSEAVGQMLMVGLPADINTVRDSGSQDVDKVVTKHQVGFVIPKHYTYFDDSRLQPDEYLGKVVDFNNAVQAKALKGPLGLPVFFATDFEGPILTPIKRGLIPPPSAIALSATQDKQSLIAVGNLVGFQLRNIGIHILLGPVLDIYNLKQGNKNGLQDRSFASTPDGVARTASNFMFGAKQAGLILFAKHYPSHGAVETNPHDPVIPQYEGSHEQRAGELKPYEMNHSMIDGVMTAHIEVDVGKGRKIATFSSDLLGELAGKESLSNKIFITDDLSDMGAVRKYMTINNASYADIAIQAFDAGHDLLMFAHLSKNEVGPNREKTNKPSNFRVRDFEAVVNRLTMHIRSNRMNEAKFKRSLEKIVRLKAQVARQHGLPIEKLLKKGKSDTLFHVPNNGQQVIEKTEENLVTMMRRNDPDAISTPEQHGIREQVVLSALKKAAVEFRLPKKDSVRLMELPNQSRVLFAAYESDLDKFREAFSSHFPSALFLTVPLEKNTDKFRKLEQVIEAEYLRSDLLIYTAYDESDADLLSRLHHRHGRDFAKKTLILLHTSPAVLDSAMIGDAHIIATFTRHSMSAQVDTEILLGQHVPRGLENLPVNVGDNGKYYSVSNTTWVMPADSEIFEAVFAVRKELESCVPVVKEKYLLIPNAATTYGLLFFTFMIGLIVVVLPPRVMKEYCSESGQINPWAKKMLDSYWITGMLALIVMCIMISLFFFPGKIQNFIMEQYGLADSIGTLRGKVSRLH